jgi:nicotinamidase/pyrazinamidase
MKPETTLFWDVDTQRDFMLPDGKLYAPGAEKIIPTLASLTELAHSMNIRIAGDVDRHYKGDPELIRNGGPYPDHCMNGTPGQRKIAETEPRNALFVENRAMSEKEIDDALDHRGDIVIEKQHIDVFQGNRNVPKLVPRLVRKYEDVVIYGVCTDVCVDYVVRGLLTYGRKLHVVTDAIAALDAKKGKACMENWRASGVEMLTFDELRSRLSS